MSKTNQLSGAIRFALLAAATSTFAAAPAFAQEEEEAATLETVEVTGSRIKRADIEGALPVTVISRAQIDASGDVSVAEFLRDTTFNSTGSFRPQSGSSAQAGAEISLRGLGASRTLVLVDGRRAPKSPFTGNSADLNSIPLAAVERIEILSDGASAIYGSDAIGGVVNIITRKDYSGVQFTYGMGTPSYEGGETEEASLIMGISGDRGTLLAGVGMSSRGMVFTRERPWGTTPGASTYGNNYRLLNGAETGYTTGFLPVPGGCTDPGFYISPNNGRCVFNFNLVAADEAEIKNHSAFARGEFDINDNWSTYLSTTVSRVKSFGRYAPDLGALYVPIDSPNNPTYDPVAGTGTNSAILYHRFAALGNRDTYIDSNVYDVMFGFQGRLFDKVDVDFGVRQSEFKYFELGRNYVIQTLAEQAIADGSYDIYNPGANSADVLNGMKATINRESTWTTREVFGLATFDVFEMSGGASMMAVGFEYRDEDYKDLYDSLQEAGLTPGSAGNSAAGGRDITALYAEWVMPITSNFEVSLAARYEDYSDYGSDLAPKIAARWQPLDNLTIRASYGQGFAAPTLDILTQKDAFSADTVFDPATCLAYGDYPGAAGLAGRTPAEYCAEEGGLNGVQIDAYRKANPNLGSEQSDQYSIGVAWDPTDWLNITLDYYNITIEDRIAFFSSQTLVNIDIGQDPLNRPFPGAPCSLTRDPLDGNAIDTIENCYFNQGEIKTDGADLKIRTNFDFGGWGNLMSQLDVGWLNSQTVDGGPNSVGNLGVPEFRATLMNQWNINDFSFNWNMRHIDENGRASSQTLHDLQANWSAPWNGRITIGVTNVENELPELIAYGSRNFNFNLYDAYGRTPYIRYTQEF
ncbi:TonB-dependent receptor [Arenimonas caeni]|jgi:iron complex outermembrane receptor protein|uniref:TonB-dependent receptor plug domain-containing protein n=1 Tax=Arenimonas caeni TaxID=2058085 RepID=UPI002A3672FD|nr:TonB-dependent receptor [Arenimonas caeni]MDY0022322.1 TonB-dependent receptor [Arenimonas caeni]